MTPVEELEEARRCLQEAEEALATFEDGMALWAGMAGGLTEEKEDAVRDLRHQRLAEVEHWREVVQRLEANQMPSHGMTRIGEQTDEHSGDGETPPETPAAY